MSETKKATNGIYVSVGSNLGDRLKNCRDGIAALTAAGDIALEKQSPFYQTEPVDFRDQDWFVNCAVRISTGIGPLKLLSRLNQIETDAGRREKTIRFGPRILDLDIIFYNGRVIHSPELTIPHPRMHKRHFVLKPICDIDPDVVHPVLKERLFELLIRLDTKNQRLKRYPCDC
jgi:2-amino-4-hydroxy-6-hydroxymethyldihydropteridine diphosphokinase